MGFQLKDFVSITAGMINRAKATQTRLTDFNIGSVGRTLMESPAIEIEQLYMRMFAGIMDAIPVSIYRGFGFDVLDPVKARGNVVITFAVPLETPVTVAQGSIFLDRVTGRRYLAIASYTAPAGAASLVVVVDAERAGSAYNAGAGQIAASAGLTLPVGATIANEAILTGGDGETDEERKARFSAYIQSISRGTVFSVKYAAGTARILDGSGAVVEYVSRVDVFETPGYVQLFIYGADAAPSAALLAEVRKIIDGYFDAATNSYVPGYRPIGVDVVVAPMVEDAISLTATITPAAGYLVADLAGAVQQAIGDAIWDVHAGETLYVDALRNAALAVPGVDRVLLSLTANSVCPANVVYVPGTITVVAG